MEHGCASLFRVFNVSGVCAFTVDIVICSSVWLVSVCVETVDLRACASNALSTLPRSAKDLVLRCAALVKVLCLSCAVFK